MKGKFLKITVLTVALITVFTSVFTLGVSAQTWEITPRMSLEDISMKAELYDGVLKLSAKNGNGRSASVSLSLFMGANIPWRDVKVRQTIKEVYFSFGITSLEGLEMFYLDNAEILHIPASVKSLGRSGSFGMMLKLKKIYYGGTQKQWDKLAEGIEIENELIKPEIICESSDGERECDEMWEVGLYNKSDVIASRAGDTLYLEGRGQMEDYKLSVNGLDDLSPWVQNDNIKHVVICDGVRNVGDYAFWNNNEIEDVVIAGSVVTIGEEAFYGTSVQEVTVPASVTEIRKNAFGSCGKLATVYLTQNVDKIGPSAFDGCPQFGKINYSGSKYYWDRIAIGENNEEIEKATLICNYVAETEKNEISLKQPVTPNLSAPQSSEEEPTAEPETEAKSETKTKTERPVLLIVLAIAAAAFAVLSTVLAVLLAKTKKAVKKNG